MTNKEQITKLVNDMLNDSIEAMRGRIETVLNSGCVDVDNWDANNSPMILPKTIIVALLEDEAVQYKGIGTSYEKRIKKEVKNIKYFI